MRLENKVAIVTGGAGGIGRGILSRFLDEGASVLVIDIVPQADGEAIVAEIAAGRPVAYLQKDIADPANAPVIVGHAVEIFGKLDVLVNNAHASKQALIMDTTQEMWDLSFGTGLFATFNLMQAAHDELAKTKGAIVNFASGSGLKGRPTQATYAAAKEAIRAITRVAANEWAAEGIRANIVSPVAMTPGIQAWAKTDPAGYEVTRSGVPLGRLGDPADDIAPVVAFLASDDARYVTGQTIMADGGSIMLH